MSNTSILDKKILTIASNDNSPIKAESEFYHARYGDEYTDRVAYLKDKGYIDADSISIDANDAPIKTYKINTITSAGKAYLARI